MPDRSPEERAASRAEARRRARLAARGQFPSDEPEAEDPEPARRRGGFIQRIFPPAPPLPNRPDPLAGFDRTGPLRPVREALFLLRRNPLAWVIPGVLAFVGLFGSLVYPTEILGLLGTFLLFGSLIGAGWVGWQRPALYGTTAALLSFVLATGVVLGAFSQRGAGPDLFGEPLAVIAQLLFQAIYQGGLGFLGGWYGGYLRRRQAQVSATTQRRR